MAVTIRSCLVADVAAVEAAMDLNNTTSRNNIPYFFNETYRGNFDNLSGSFSQEDYQPYIPLYMYILVSVLNGSIFLFGLGGNCLVVIVIVKSRGMRTPTNLFLFSLSIADILVLLFCQPAALLEFYGKDRWLIGGFMCKLIPLLENGALSVSIMTMSAVTAERYIAICHPFKRGSSCTAGDAAKLILVLWVLGFLFSLPFLIMTDLEDALFYDGTPIHVCRTRVDTFWRKLYVICVFIMFFALPLLILVFTYARIVKQLISESLTLFASAHDRSAKFSLQLRKQVVRMLIVIVSLFFITLCPIRVVSLWLIFTPTKDVVSMGLEAFLNLMSFSRIMMYLNSAINPLVYNMTSRKFRTAFRKVLQRRSSKSTSVSRNAVQQNKHDVQDLSPAVENSHLYKSSPRLIVKLLIYAGKQEGGNENTLPEVVNEEFPLHVIYEEDHNKARKGDE